MTEYKPMEYYLNLPWTFEVSRSDDTLEPWTVRIQELPGCMTHGKTPQEAMSNVNEAIESYLMAIMESDEPIPEPVQPEDYRGQFSIRTTPEKHYRIAKVAQRRKVSINRLINEAIENIISEAG